MSSDEALDTFDSLDREKIRSFLAAGGNVNARGRGRGGWTVLHRAAVADLVEGVRNLLEFGADPDLPVTPGSSTRTVDVIRHNGDTNAAQIESILRNAGRGR